MSTAQAPPLESLAGLKQLYRHLENSNDHTILNRRLNKELSVSADPSKAGVVKSMLAIGRRVTAFESANKKAAIMYATFRILSRPAAWGCRPRAWSP
ncbi:hypothetical protein EVAR_42714_1 [Eumeta japonica]|uniref:Uncharacterized protein n=1 Tax=Eumeta variegata TaxID=151549 RepID=A0A4C1X093_EUMVA|nr:hypothetical protein EVAR_42714_1 [Eumeta japonica]